MGFQKNSPEAKEHMSKMRAMRGKNKSNQSTINNAPQPVRTNETEAPKRRGRLIRGSIEAKEYMSSIRPKR